MLDFSTCKTHCAKKLNHQFKMDPLCILSRRKQFYFASSLMDKINEHYLLYDHFPKKEGLAVQFFFKINIIASRVTKF